MVGGGILFLSYGSVQLRLSREEAFDPQGFFMDRSTPEDLHEYLQPTFYVDSDSPVVSEFTRSHATGETQIERAVSLFRAVRDEILYDPYRIRLAPEEFRAGVIIERRAGFCVAKAIALAAVARAAGIPSRLGFADVDRKSVV
jgi:transglutaminase-like putative cysteine protease